MTRYEHIPSGLDTTTSKTCLKGLPRVRGDRPKRQQLSGSGALSPPRARGSTFDKRKGGASFVVSPASAGNDLNFWTLSATFARLPRVRGDRPLKIIGKHLIAMSPPRARGSTWERLKDGLAALVSPACAGIDREKEEAMRQAEVSPRARDRPVSWNTTLSNSVSPRARGSTRPSLNALGEIVSRVREDRLCRAWTGGDCLPTCARSTTAIQAVLTAEVSPRVLEDRRPRNRKRNRSLPACARIDR